MDEQTFNLGIRKVLKRFGVAAQREIEKAVDTAMARGEIGGHETLGVKIELTIPDAGLDFTIEDTIDLA